jgi:spore germination protein KA
MKEQTPFTGILEEDLALFKDLFRYPENRTLLFRVFETPSLGSKAAVLYIDGVADTTMMENAIVEPMLQISSVGKPPKPAERADFLIDHILKVVNLSKVASLEKAAQYMLNGFAVILAEGCVQGITAEVPGFAGRPVLEAKIEQTVKGPRESFTESMAANRSLIRKYMRDHRLMCEELTIGAEPEAKVSIMYMDQVADEEIVQKVKDRIKQIESEEVANLSILEKHIEERPYSLQGGNRFGAFGVALLALSHGVLMYWLIMDNRS